MARGHVLQVSVDDFINGSIGSNLAFPHPDPPVAQRSEGREVVRDDRDDVRAVKEAEDACLRLVEEGRIAGSQRLVDQKDIGIDLGRDRKGEGVYIPLE